MNKTSFHTLLKIARNKTGFTQAELAEKLNLHFTYISRFENNVIPNPQTLLKIINELKLSQKLDTDELNALWETAGFPFLHLSEVPTSNPVVDYINQELDKLDNEKGEKLVSELKATLEIEQMYFQVMRDSEDGMWEKVLTNIHTLREKSEEQMQKRYKHYDYLLGRAYYFKGEYEKAVFWFETALWSASQLNDPLQKATILVELGDTLRRKGGPDLNLALKRYDEAIDVYTKQEKTTKPLINCLRKKGAVHLYKGNIEEAEELINDSLRRAQEEGYERGIYKALQHLTWLKDLRGDWEEAVNDAEKALDMVRKSNKSLHELINALRYTADAHRLNRNNEKAEEYYRDAYERLKKDERKGVSGKLYMGMVQLGLAKVLLKDPNQRTKAIQFLEESLQTHLQLGEDFRIADVLRERGEVLMIRDRYAEAERQLEAALARMEKQENLIHKAHILSLLCQAYYEMGTSPTRVFEAAEKVRSINNQYIDYHLAHTEFYVAKTHLLLGQFPAAGIAFGEATYRALCFNATSFKEMKEKIFVEINKILKIPQRQYIFSVLEAYRVKVDASTLPAEKRLLAEGLLDEINLVIKDAEAVGKIELAE
jgi:tetratricopeptide (TPR) repeat protein